MYNVKKNNLMMVFQQFRTTTIVFQAGKDAAS